MELIYTFCKCNRINENIWTIICISNQITLCRNHRLEYISSFKLALEIFSRHLDAKQPPQHCLKRFISCKRPLSLLPQSYLQNIITCVILITTAACRQYYMNPIMIRIDKSAFVKMIEPLQ